MSEAQVEVALDTFDDSALRIWSRGRIPMWAYEEARPVSTLATHLAYIPAAVEAKGRAGFEELGETELGCGGRLIELRTLMNVR